ncbi:MAG: 16S rRNA (cytosine(1402)-N(4))-methyltransferase RsmH [Cyanothece sp. SIO2G6]|nr:16S rRNA (cytosine(1402)-N(4))-methyltransferase RsmH [Cyanothece sp. SIO2G6]
MQSGQGWGVRDVSVEFKHVSVLMEEAIAALNLQPQGYYLDATVGGGGHSQQILERVAESRVVGIDQDGMAIAAAQAQLQDYGDRIQFWQGNFSDYDPGEQQFDGILADLGVSSAQLDLPERGFSFRHDAPLDMRMNSDETLTAADIVNHWDEKQLADVIYQYGEERLSRRIARRIVEKRPLHTTTQLADEIWHSVPRSYRYGKIHPATRTFQALRIAVNRELEVLQDFLTVVPHWLGPGGRLVIISFHSLEDRIVKHSLRQHERLTVLSKKPIVPTEAECATNPRARSAKLRVAELALKS